MDAVWLDRLPLLAFQAALLMAACLLFFDATQSVLLYPPGWETYAVRLGQALHYGVEAETAAAALAGFGLTLLALFLLLLGRRLCRKRS